MNKRFSIDPELLGENSRLKWHAVKDDDEFISCATRGRVRFEIFEAFGDFVLWMKTDDQIGLVSIAASEKLLARQAEDFLARAVPFAESRNMDLPALILTQTDQMATLWTLVGSPETIISEVEDGDQS